MAAIVLGGTGYVFRHSLLPQDHGAVEHAGAGAETPMAVSVIAAARRVVSRRVVAGGTLVARDEVLVPGQVAGSVVTRVLADVGDRVDEGAPLAMLDDAGIVLRLAQNAADLRRAEAARAQAEAMLAEADAAAADATQQRARAATLQARGATSEQALEERRTAADTATARAAAQRHALDIAAADLARVAAERDELLWQQEHLTIRAPAGGIVTERSAQEGQAAPGDGSPLFRIAKAGTVEMEALVVETALALIREGQAVSVSVAGAEGTTRGKVRLVAPTVDPTSRMGRVRIALDGDALRPGSFASARFDLNPRRAVLLPHAAVLGGASDAHVMVVRAGIAAVVPVTVGRNTVEGIEIVDGLEEGERVIASAGGFLREGSRVTPIPVADPAPEEGGI